MNMMYTWAFVEMQQESASVMNGSELVIVVDHYGDEKEDSQGDNHCHTTGE